MISYFERVVNSPKVREGRKFGPPRFALHQSRRKSEYLPEIRSAMVQQTAEVLLSRENTSRVNSKASKGSGGGEGVSTPRLRILDQLDVWLKVDREIEHSVGIVELATFALGEIVFHFHGTLSPYCSTGGEAG
jgi:hypothetical protein